MKSPGQLMLAILSLLTLPYGSFEQQPPWPRNPTSGKVEFAGTLPWPASATTIEQQQQLVRNWYLTKLTDETSETLGKAVNAEFTYARLPAYTYLDSTRYPQDKWKIRSIRLFYQVRLTPTPVGLTYRLSDFECAEIIFDTGNSASLEEVLQDSPPAEAPILAVFYQRLLSALATW